MSEEEHLHSFREQVGDTLKVLNEYSKAPVDKAIRKAGKYIDRMAKSAIPLMKTTEPEHYKELAEVGAAAAKLKADETDLEQNRDTRAKLEGKDNITDKGKEDLEKANRAIPELEKSIPEQAKSLKELSKKYGTVQKLREDVTKVGVEVEKDFRKFQVEKNKPQNPNQQEPMTEQDSQVKQIQNNLRDAQKKLDAFPS
jgi:chromosome segregation ATPase